MGRLRTYEHKTFAATGLGASFSSIGTVLSDECVEFTAYNTSDVDAIISLDGSSDSIIVPAGLSCSSRAFEDKKQKLLIAKGVQLKAKQVTGAGASGNITINLTLEG